MPVTYSRLGNALTGDRLAEVVGTDVAEDYRSFMLHQNGGVLARSAHLPNDRSGASVRAFLVVDDPEGLDGYDLSRHLAVYEGRYPDGFLPIAVDASSNLVLLDTGYEQPGSIWFWDHEGEADEDEPARVDNIIKIADTFAAFHAALTTEFDAAEQALIDAAVATGTARKGPYHPKEPFTFGGRPAGD